MVRRTTRVKQFSEIQRLQILAQLENTRLYINRLHAQVRPFSNDYNALTKVNEAIDVLAEEWTGNRAHLHTKPHSAGGGG